MKKMIGTLCMSMLLGATVLTPVTSMAFEDLDMGTWQKGGLATNQTTGSAKIQKGIATASALYGLITSAGNFLVAWTPITFPFEICALVGCLGGYSSGPIAWGLNIDGLGLTADGIALYDAMNKEAKLTEKIPELQAQIRNIGSFGSLEECLENKERAALKLCNGATKTLDATEVHVNSLKNVGLEALEDVKNNQQDMPGLTNVLNGEIPVTAEKIMMATQPVQMAFGTKTLTNTSVPTLGGLTGQKTDVLQQLSDALKAKERAKKSRTSTAVSDEQLKEWEVRRDAHLQYTGTAGVARADIASTVATSNMKDFDRLSSYVGTGASVIANYQVLGGLDLTLAQNLNLLNMLQGQQVANDAAAALLVVDTAE